MNYKSYLFERKMSDSIESYRKYCEEFVFEQMHIIGKKNKDMFIKVTFKYRFTNFSWAEGR